MFEAMAELLDRMDSGVEQLHDAPAGVWAVAEHGEALLRVLALRSRVEAAYLHLLATFDARPDHPGLAAPGATGSALLVHEGHLDLATARRDVRAAHAVDPDLAGVGVPRPPTSTGLPRFGAALAAGQVSRDHLDAVLTRLTDVPDRLLTAVDESGHSGAARIDAFLTGHAAHLTPRELGRVTAQLVAALTESDDDAAAALDAARHRRGLSMAQDSSGVWTGRFTLDPVAGALVRAAIDSMMQLATPGPEGAAEGGAGPVRDRRTAAQRQADALTDLARSHLYGRADSAFDGDRADSASAGGREDSAPAGTSRVPGGTTADRRPGAQIFLWATATQIAAARATTPAPFDENGAPIRPPEGHATQLLPEGLLGPPGLPVDLGTGTAMDLISFGIFLCDAVLSTTMGTADGAVLDQGRRTRLTTPAQRRALIARDRGCIVPGCTAPIHWCDAHHVVWWRHGGATDIDNLALLCGRHHTDVHTGRWRIQMIGGVPWAVPPRDLDPTRTPRRSTLRSDEHDARRLGHALSRPNPPPPRHSTNHQPAAGGEAA